MYDVNLLKHGRLTEMKSEVETVISGQDSNLSQLSYHVTYAI